MLLLKYNNQKHFMGPKRIIWRREGAKYISELTTQQGTQPYLLLSFRLEIKENNYST